jgi:preprotein translocase subunit SecA
VTVATNMAGRGTDILLGGNPEFMAQEACLKKHLKSGSRRARNSRKFVATRKTSTSTIGDALSSAGGRLDEEVFEIKRTMPKHDEVVARRPAHRRHRTPRIPAHRQPVARPCRPSGRPRHPPGSTSPSQDDLLRIFGGIGFRT